MVYRFNPINEIISLPGIDLIGVLVGTEILYCTQSGYDEQFLRIAQQLESFEAYSKRVHFRELSFNIRTENGAVFLFRMPKNRRIVIYTKGNINQDLLYLCVQVLMPDLNRWVTNLSSSNVRITRTMTQELRTLNQIDAISMLFKQMTRHPEDWDQLLEEWVSSGMGALDLIRNLENSLNIRDQIRFRREVEKILASFKEK